MNNMLIKILPLMLGAALAVSGCDDGPAENAGENIDEAVSDTANAIEDKCEQMKESVRAQDPDC